jgi:hypothetical protein
MPRRPAQERAESDAGILRRKINEFADLVGDRIATIIQIRIESLPNERPHYRLTALAILNDD